MSAYTKNFCPLKLNQNYPSEFEASFSTPKKKRVTFQEALSENKLINKFKNRTKFKIKKQLKEFKLKEKNFPKWKKKIRF